MLYLFWVQIQMLESARHQDILQLALVDQSILFYTLMKNFRCLKKCLLKIFL